MRLGENRAVIGAPGSGKTSALITRYSALLDETSSDASALIVAPTRLAASVLRAKLDEEVIAPAGGPRVRTAVSLALAVLQAERRARGELPLQLLTGSLQDELVGEAVDVSLAGSHSPGLLRPDVMLTPGFRNEFRELLRVLNEQNVDLLQLRAIATEYDVAEWAELVPIVEIYRSLLRSRHPLHRDASDIFAEAAALLQKIPNDDRAIISLADLASLRVLLIDDLQEHTQGAINLFAAFASRGVTIWGFGDPDVSTGAFQGAAHRALSNLGNALGVDAAEPLILDRVFRHPVEIRRITEKLSRHIGTAGLGQQREAQAERVGGNVRFTRLESQSEASGAIAHYLRQANLGLTELKTKIDWSEMAVICRTRSEANRVARELSAAEVPTDITAGGRVLAEHPIVRDMLVASLISFGWEEPDAKTIRQLLGGPLGGLDQLAIKRLLTSLQLVHGRNDDRKSDDQLLELYFGDLQAELPINTRQSEAMNRLRSCLLSGAKSADTGGDLSEVLWALWSSTPLPNRWEKQAGSESEPIAEAANEALDAVLALFFAAARFEEQEIREDREEFIRSLLDSTVPEDSLSNASQRSAVTVTTAQGMVGREAEIVVVTQLQDGIWPNLKSRGSILQLERLVNCANSEPERPLADRRDVMHDELRLFTQAVSRAKSQLLVVAIQNEDTLPSQFFNAVAPDELEALESTRLTLRGMVAALRRRLASDPQDREVAEQLALLAIKSVPGAHPESWYGIAPISSDRSIEGGAENPVVSVSPSRLETFEKCPLNWAISKLGGDNPVSAGEIGTLLHLAMETAPDHSFDALIARVDKGWSMLSFETEWQSERSHKKAESMARSLSTYLREFDAAGGELFGAEQKFTLEYGTAVVSGTVDRVELRPSADGANQNVLIVDLKTQNSAPSAKETEEHLQLAMYQLAAAEGKLHLPSATIDGAALLLVSPKVVGASAYKICKQAPLSEERQGVLIQKVVEAAAKMNSSTFNAEVEHHCTDDYSYGNCKLHIIRSVSAE